MCFVKKKSYGKNISLKANWVDESAPVLNGQYHSKHFFINSKVSSTVRWIRTRCVSTIWKKYYIYVFFFIWNSPTVVSFLCAMVMYRLWSSVLVLLGFRINCTYSTLNCRCSCSGLLILHWCWPWVNFVSHFLSFLSVWIHFFFFLVFAFDIKI